MSGVVSVDKDRYLEKSLYKHLPVIQCNNCGHQENNHILKTECLEPQISATLNAKTVWVETTSKPLEAVQTTGETSQDLDVIHMKLLLPTEALIISFHREAYQDYGSSQLKRRRMHSESTNGPIRDRHDRPPDYE